MTYQGKYRGGGEWSGPVEMYKFKCKIHGDVIDYPHGHAMRLECPLCVGEALDLSRAEALSEIDKMKMALVDLVNALPREDREKVLARPMEDPDTRSALKEALLSRERRRILVEKI